jgi:hypothetical protein
MRGAAATLAGAWWQPSLARGGSPRWRVGLV